MPEPRNKRGRPPGWSPPGGARVHVNARLAPEAHEALTAYAEAHGLTIARAIDALIMKGSNQ